MKTVVVIGCGFAGISAIKVLSRYPQRVSLIVIDKNPTSDFLPLLPDIIGRGLSRKNIAYPIETLIHAYRFRFIHSSVTGVDLSQKKVCTDSAEISYDYLLIASGSETNFYENTAAKEHAFRLDSARDAERIRDAIKQSTYSNILISGGGYTGIEIASSLRRYCTQEHQYPAITVVERAPHILGPLPPWMRDCIHRNLNDLKIEVLTDSTITEIAGQNITVNTSHIFHRAILIWSAGVKTADYIQKLPLPKNPQGRLISDPCLQIEKSCFVAGDVALLHWNNAPLRMSVQFAITQGACAAKNILRATHSKTTAAFKPVDPGFIIPLANNHAYGMIFGLPIKGILPVFLHFFLCLYRLHGISNKYRVLIELLQAEFKKNVGRWTKEIGDKDSKTYSDAQLRLAKGIRHSSGNKNQ